MFLISSVDIENSKTNKEVFKILTKLFIESQFFEDCTEEIEIWVNSLGYLKSTLDRDEVGDWIVKIVKQTSKHMEKYDSLVHKMGENIEEQGFKSGTTDIFESMKNFNNKIYLGKSLPISSIVFFSIYENFSCINNRNMSFQLICWFSIVLTFF